MKTKIKKKKKKYKNKTRRLSIVYLKRDEDGRLEHKSFDQQQQKKRTISFGYYRAGPQTYRTHTYSCCCC
jgi:hypothetical protein